MDDRAPAPPLYAVVDQRQDGRQRVVAQFVAPGEATAACEALRASGAVAARVEVVCATDVLVEAPPREL